MPRLIDLTGQRFGRLVAIEKAPHVKGVPVYWTCRCDCGTVKDIAAVSLRNGSTRSCGCLQKETVSKIRKLHGDKGSRLYVVWHSMVERCRNSKKPFYKYYGGRGIQVCEEWKVYSNFKEWAFKNGYNQTAKHGECTLDRINNDGDYSPQNCRWVSMKEQSKNKHMKGYLEK